MSYEKGRTITDVLAKIIEEKFEQSSMNNKCTHSRHITELMNCPVFMNKKIHYTKNKDEIMTYIRDYIQKVKNYLIKRNQLQDKELVESVLMDEIANYIETHKDFTLFFGLHVYRDESSYGKKMSKSLLYKPKSCRRRSPIRRKK